MASTTLKQASQRIGFAFGFGTSLPRSDPGTWDATIRAIQDAQASWVNCSPWMPLMNPARGVFDFAGLDLAVAWAEEHGKRIGNLQLIMDGPGVPSWVGSNDGGFIDPLHDQATLRAIAQEWIQAVSARYGHRFASLTVYGECLSYNTGFWVQNLGFGDPGTQAGGRATIAQFLRWAREASPTAVLIHDEAEAVYDTQTNANNLYNAALEFQAQGVPIDGVSLQWWMNGASPPDYAAAARNIQRFRALGLHVEIPSSSVQNFATTSQQAQIYHDAVSTAVSAGARVWQVWGIPDQSAPIDPTVGADSLLYEEAPGYTPKPYLIDAIIAAMDEYPAALSAQAGGVVGGSTMLSGYRPAGTTVSVTCPSAEVGSVAYPTPETWEAPASGLSPGANVFTVAAGTASVQATVYADEALSLLASSAVVGLFAVAPSVTALQSNPPISLNATAALLDLSVASPAVRALAETPASGVCLADGTPLDLRLWNGTSWASAPVKLHPFN